MKGLNEVSFLEYNSGAKLVIYDGFHALTDDMKTVVNRIVGDKELDTIKNMSTEDVKELVSNVLQDKPMNLNIN